MVLDVNKANNQANSLNMNIEQLKQTKGQLQAYQVSILQYWQGKEVKYIQQAIAQTIAQIDQTIKQLDKLSKNIKSTAAAIKKEDEAALAAKIAIEKKQQAIQKAQREYDEAVNELDELNKKKEELDNILSKKLSKKSQESYLKELEELEIKIEDAKKHCDDSLKLLKQAKK